MALSLGCTVLRFIEPNGANRLLPVVINSECSMWQSWFMCLATIFDKNGVLVMSLAGEIMI